MCTRYISPDEAAMERFWEIGSRHHWRGPPQIFPRALGPFLREDAHSAGLEMVVGQWGLIPWFAKTPALSFSTSNARFEDITSKASFKGPWHDCKRCIIPAWSFDEPCWESGKNVWWRFHRMDARPWSLAGLWNRWVDKATGEVHESYTMLTINADSHPIMSRMHKPDPKVPADMQDKRSVVALEIDDLDAWLHGSLAEAVSLIRPPAAELIEAAPAGSLKQDVECSIESRLQR
jgi:putative SOS response-associated peptidase YedK